MADIPLIVSIGAKKGPQRWDWEYMKQVIGKEGQQTQQQWPSLPGCTLALVLGPQGCDPMGCYDNKAS